MTRADARGGRAGRSEPGGREEDAQHWMGEKRLQQAEACWCCLVWSRRWIEGVRSATGRHRSRCRLRGPRQRVPEPEDGTGNAPDWRFEERNEQF